MLARLRDHAAALHRSRGSLACTQHALDSLAGELPAGLDRLLGRIASDMADPDELARRAAELVRGGLVARTPEPRGMPRLVLVAAIALATDGRAAEPTEG